MANMKAEKGGRGEAKGAARLGVDLSSPDGTAPGATPGKPGPKREHTPGRWKVRPRENRSHFLEVMPGSGGGNVCSVYAPSTQRDQEQDANARLIAAAPELLAACEIALGEIIFLHPRSTVQYSLEEATATIRAAIKLAGGAS